MTNLVNGESLPRGEGFDGIKGCFRVHDGFHFADNAVALDRALQPILRQLKDQRNDPWTAVKNKHLIRATLARAEKLSPSTRPPFRRRWRPSSTGSSPVRANPEQRQYGASRALGPPTAGCSAASGEGDSRPHAAAR